MRERREQLAGQAGRVALGGEHGTVDEREPVAVGPTA
jgi:hypothetical protein